MSKMTYEEQDPDELTMSYLRGVHDGKKQRIWNALTELEMAEFVKTMERGNFLVAIYDIEKKLKEKNA